MSENKDFPTTDKYKIGVDVDLQHKSLCADFRDCAAVYSSQETIKKLIHNLTGRDDVNLMHFEEKGSNAYHAGSDTIMLAPSRVGIDTFMWITKDNLPPNIPEQLTPDLLFHLVALHETEHVTQFSLEKTDDGQDVTSIKSTLVQGHNPNYNLMSDIAKEVDADLAIIKHLENLDLPNVAQFWKDMRSVASFVVHFPLSSPDGMPHDTTAILHHFETTGKVLDPDHLIDEKLDLAGKIHDKLGINRDFLSTMMVINTTPPLETLEAKLQEESVRKDLLMRPQQIMTAVQELLNEGQLTGLQKWEAENYMDAMHRLGYTPEPAGDYTNKAANALKTHFGYTIPDKTIPRAGEPLLPKPPAESPLPIPTSEPQSPIEVIQPKPIPIIPSPIA